jgi:prepilin-type N-terminal cleavage/methylation domain-containing protein
MTLGNHRNEAGGPTGSISRAAPWRVETPQAGLAFTLMELLIVIGILGILATVSVPAIRGLTQSNTIAAAHRQMLDDLGLARQLAITGRRTVYMVLVPPTMRNHFEVINKDPVLTDQQKKRQLQYLTNLISGQYTAYALFTKRSVGDQPGRNLPRYLTEWKHLPEGMMFWTNRFVDLKDKWTQEAAAKPDTNRALPYGEFRFPTSIAPAMRLPYVAFNAKGQITYDDGFVARLPGEAVSITRGSVFFEKDKDGNYVTTKAPDVIETAKTAPTHVRVNWVTGRAKVERPELK